MNSPFILDAIIDLNILNDKTVAVLGFGNQGSAHALNLRDSGVDVIVGARPDGAGFQLAVDEGFDTLSIGDAAARADVAMLTLPDTVCAEVFEEQIRPLIRPDVLLLFAHGYCVHFGLIQTQNPLGLVSPKGPGKSLRQRFCAGSGLPALVATENDSTGEYRKLVLAYAKAIGCARVGLLPTTFHEETVTDLFGEQAVLCGGIPELIKASFTTLINAGYRPEAAFFECLFEAKLIIDLLLERGFEGMREAISDTAEWGGYLAGRQLIDSHVREKLAEILESIESGVFSQQLSVEKDNAFHTMLEMRSEESKDEIEQTWKRVIKFLEPSSKI